MARRGSQASAVAEGNSGFANIHDDDVFTPNQLAFFLGVTARTVKEWTNRKSGDGPALRSWKSGTLIFIRGVHIKRFFDGASEA